MNGPSFYPSSSHDPLPLPASEPGEAGSKAAPDPHNRDPGLGLVRWIQENTFAPEWLPEPLRRPFFGYVAAVLIQAAAVSLTLVLLVWLPGWACYTILAVLGVAVVALAWGVGPSFVASLVGTLLIWFVVVPPQFSFKITSPTDGVALFLYAVVSITVSLLAGQNERGRRRAKDEAQWLAQAEARSRVDADHLRTVLEVLPAAVMITNPQGQLLATNQAATTLWSRDIPLGTSLTQYSQDNRFRAWWARTGQPLAHDDWPLVRALSSGQAVLNEELEIETPDGQRKAVFHSAALLRDESGVITGAVVSAQDISELRRLEREADERAQELDAVFESMTDGVFVYAADGAITRANAAGRQMLGADSHVHDSPMQKRAALQSPRDKEGLPLPFEQIPSVRILRGEVLTGTQAGDVYFLTPSGHLHAFSTNGTPLRSADGAIIGAVTVTRDVSERHWLEREVVERAQELETIVAAVTDGIALLDSNGELIRTNQAFRRLLGFEQHPEYLTLPYKQRQAAFTVRTVQGQPITLDTPRDSAPIRGNAFTGVDVVIENLDGREVVVNVDGVPLHDQRGNLAGYIEVYRDMTARHYVEQRTRETLAALVAMAEAMVEIRPATPRVDEADPVSTSAVSADAALSLVARRLAELTRSVLLCRRVSIAAVDPTTGHLYPVTEVGLPPESAPASQASWTPPQHLEDRYGPAIASMLYAGKSALLDVQHLPERSWYSLFGAQSGCIMPMRLGEELVGVLMVDYSEPEHDYSRQEEILLTTTLAQLGALVLERDRLLRGWAETRANELALYETKAQMDTFLGIASHELKTPLTSLKLSLQLSQRQLLKVTQRKNAAVAAEGDAGLHIAVEQLGRTAHQMRRMEALVNDLVDVSRIQAGKLELRPEHTDLVAIVHEAVTVQQDAEPERSIRLQLPSDRSVPVYADAGRIEQVVTNFLTNALKYSPADRQVEVGLEVEPEQARVWVRDYGPGLPASEQEHIWERFHRAQGVEVQSGAGVGLGLGLFISRMIVERHHGQVGVLSTEGEGATFWFTVPMSHSNDE
jgi:signal transduction histidine kinase/PAS domain-containing protein